MSNPSTPDDHQDTSHDNSSTPSLAPLKGWSYPFPAKIHQAADAATYFKALGNAQGGFYPLGSNGMWHGGIHFDGGTGRDLNQMGGMQAIADGEVVAYRLDNDYPLLKYPDGKLAIYATGYVLVHHRLAIPTLPAAIDAGDDATPASGNAAASDTSGSDDVLDFYCLYMHQASWQSYLADSSMERPKFWEASSGRAFRIAKADRQDASHEDSVEEDTSAIPVATRAARLYGAHVRAAPKRVGYRYVGGEVIGFLKEGGEVKVGNIQGEGRHRWGQITTIVSGEPLSTTAGGATPEVSTLESEGWIYLAEQVSVIEPDLEALGSTVVLSPPVSIGAGERVGHLGEYQNYDDATPLPPQPHCPIIHMEIFAGDAFPAFLAKSRAFAAQPNLPDSFKTMRLLPKGAVLITGAKPADTRVAAGLVKTPTGAADGVWVKVQPFTVGAVTAGHHSNPPLTKSGPEVWVQRNDVGAAGEVDAWSQFPLQEGLVGESTALDHVYTSAEWSKLGRVTDDHDQPWHEVVTLGPDSQSIHGWVSDANIAKVSPFAWPGFEIIDATAITPKDALQRKAVQQGTLFPGEAQEFKPAAEVVNNSALMQAIDKAMDTDHDGKLNTQELRTAMLRPVIAQGISHIIGEYESEWGGNMDRWRDLTPLMRDGAPRWQKELERIEKLQIWADLRSVDGGRFPGPTVYHFHPIGVIGNFKGGFEFTLEMMRYLFPGAAIGDLQAMVNELNKHMVFYKLDKPLRREHFFAQVMQEVGASLKLKSESLNYPPDRLINVFSYFARHRSEADVYGRTSAHPADEEAIANRAYASRGGNDSDVNVGDGWKYRGRGIIQLTGKTLYKAFTAWHKDNEPSWPDDKDLDFEANPGLVDSIKYAVRSACYYWLSNNIYLKADNGSFVSDVDNISRIVNPGLFAPPPNKDKEKSIKGRQDNFSMIHAWGGFDD